MSEFLQIKDYDASIRKEFLDALIREDEAVLHMAQHAAISEMQPYLARRYEITQCFAPNSKENGDNRHPLLLMFAKDITLYHLIAALQPAKLQGNNNLRTDRYERAIQWLKDVAKGSIQPNLPKKQNIQQHAYLQCSGNPKRHNHY